jgi:hypothetical protein
VPDGQQQQDGRTNKTQPTEKIPLVQKMRLDEKISSVAFGRSSKIDSDKNVPRIRICVLGLVAVGKTGNFFFP